MQSQNPQDMLSLHFGPKSNALGLTFFALEADQMFEQQDPINHLIYFKDPATRNPRALFFDKSSEFEALTYLNSTETNESTEKISEFWNAKLKIYNQKSPEESILSSEEHLKALLFKRVSLKKSSLIPLPNLYTSKFTEFYQGNEALKDSDHSEKVKECLRKSLEDIDLINGFQILSDCDSGFGIYSYNVIEFLKEECVKSPILLIPILEKTQETEIFKKIQVLNELFTYSTFKDVELMIPLDFQQGFSNLSEIFSSKNKNLELFEQANVIAPILNNVTLPLRLKEDRESMNDYFNKILFFKNINIFNVLATVPIIDEKGIILENDIFRFKDRSHKGICGLNEFSHPRNTKFPKDYANYSEAYMLRGLCNEKSIRKPSSYKYNIWGLDALLSYSNKKTMPELSPSILSNYGETSIEAWPLHTCLFTNDFFKDHLKSLLEEFKGIEIKIQKNFIEDEDFANDAFKEMLNSVNQIVDNYDKK